MVFFKAHQSILLYNMMLTVIKSINIVNLIFSCFLLFYSQKAKIQRPQVQNNISTQTNPVTKYTNTCKECKKVFSKKVKKQKY